MALIIEFDWSKVTVTDVVAWWGAVVATAVLVWDVVKWKLSGRPKLDVRVDGGMSLLHNKNPDQKFFTVSVTNNGDKKTTLQNLSLWHYKEKPSRFKKQHPQILVAIASRAGQQLPHVLEPGETWSGLYEQMKNVEEMLETGFLFVRVEDSSKQKTAQARFIKRDDPKALD
jgi:hypothetical protein